MKVYLAADHAGFELKEKVKNYLQQEGYTIEDCGAFNFDSNDDYPDFIKKAAEKAAQDPSSRAIVFGGSGQGEAIVANKFKNVRAAVYYGHNEEIITLSRKHNDANVLSIGARFVDDSVLESIKRWLQTLFEEEERHVRRIEKIKRIEMSNS